MIAVLSPAKTFAAEPSVSIEPTEPHFARDARRLARGAAGLGAAELQRLMRISPALAALNADRYARFGAQNEHPAIAAFDGDVYRGFDPATLDPDAMAFAAGHVRILSGMYGLLRPSDAIRHHRLEMHTPWAPAGGDLYGYWRCRVARRLRDELATEGSGVVLNLASKEYWHVVEPHVTRDMKVITVDFRDRTATGLRFNSFVAKRARGAMARYLCETRAASIDDLRGFDHAGYKYEGSDGDMMRFVR